VKSKVSLLVIIICLLFVGCSSQFKNLSGVDKAVVVAKEITTSYLTIYAIANNLTINGTDSQKEVMKNIINPKLNDLKRSITLMDDAVILWKQTGTDYSNTQAKQEAINKSLIEINKIIFELINK
jgi:hypothetical protein